MTAELAVVFLIVGSAVGYLVRLVYGMVAGSRAATCGTGGCGSCPSAATAPGASLPRSPVR